MFMHLRRLKHVHMLQILTFYNYHFSGSDIQQCDRRRQLWQHGQSGHKVYDECWTYTSRVLEPFYQQFIGTLSNILVLN